MRLVDRELVRKMAESHDPEAALVLVNGECIVVSVGEAAVPYAGVVIARRHEIEPELSGGPVDDHKLDEIAHRLDSRARDRGT